jgi:hypothetical protein
LLGALGAASLVLAAWVTTAGYVPILRGIVPDDKPRPDQRLPHAPPPPDQPPTRPRTAPDQGLPLDLLIVTYVFLILLLALIAALVVHRVVLRRRVRRDEEDVAEARHPDEGWELSAPEDLAHSASRGLAALNEGEPRDAIVRCWTELEDAVERIGLARDPALTSEEFTAAVLHQYAVGRGEIETLGALYREARFSVHPMGEDHRARAVAALRSLRDELADAAAVQVDSAGATGPSR